MSQLNRKIFFLCGFLSPLVYVLMAIVGGSMRAGYSHTYHAVSELLEAGAPNKLLLDSLLSLSNILGLLFGVGVLLLVLDSQNKRQVGLFGATCLITSGVLGLVIAFFFPMDPRHLPMTFSGMMHLILVGILSILGILTIFLLAIWLKKQADYASYGTYSFISAIIVLVTGGLAERLTIGASFQWTFFPALKLYATVK